MMDWTCSSDGDNYMQSFSRKRLVKRSLGRPRIRWNEDLNVNSKKMGCDAGNLMVQS